MTCGFRALFLHTNAAVNKCARRRSQPTGVARGCVCFSQRGLEVHELSELLLKGAPGDRVDVDLDFRTCQIIAGDLRNPLLPMGVIEGRQPAYVDTAAQSHYAWYNTRDSDVQCTRRTL